MKGISLLLIMLFLFGCINTEQTVNQEIISIPEVKDFLQKYPNARIDAFEISEKSVNAMLDDIKSNCPDFQAKDYVNVEMKYSRETLYIWYDYKNKKAECVYSETKKE